MTMPVRPNAISQSVNVGEACKERYLPLDAPGCRPLLELGLFSAGLSELYPPYDISRDRPNFHLFMYTRAGHGNVSFGDQTQSLNPGELWVFPAGSCHRYWLASDNWTIMWFHVAQADHRSHMDGLDPQRIRTGAAGEIVHIFEMLYRETWQEEDRSTEMGQHLASAMAIFLERKMALVGDTAPEHAMRYELLNLWETVADDLAYGWTVDTLAEVINISPSSLLRAVKSCEGLTPMEKVTRLRMKVARDLLLGSEYKLAAIANAVGFATPFAFSKAFKRFQGMSPREFKAQNLRDSR